jgi:hypothetical protein
MNIYMCICIMRRRSRPHPKYSTHKSDSNKLKRMQHSQRSDTRIVLFLLANIFVCLFSFESTSGRDVVGCIRDKAKNLNTQRQRIAFPFQSDLYHTGRFVKYHGLAASGYGISFAAVCLLKACSLLLVLLVVFLFLPWIYIGYILYHETSFPTASYMLDTQKWLK